MSDEEDKKRKNKIYYHERQIGFPMDRTSNFGEIRGLQAKVYTVDEFEEMLKSAPPQFPHLPPMNNDDASQPLLD